MAAPNLVLAVLDTARGPETLDLDVHPGLAGLAARGTVFRRAISPAPWTLPAHGSLFTGLLPHEHGLVGDVAVDGTRVRPVGDRVGHLAPRWAPALLREAGYRTFAASANPWITRRMGFGLGFDRFVEGWRASRNPRFAADGAPGARQASATSPIRAAARRLRRVTRSVLARHDSGASASLAAFRTWMGEGDPDRPFFAFFNFMEPHIPYQPPRPFGPRGTRARLAGARVGGRLTNEFVIRYNVGRAELDPGDLALLRALYAGELAYLDSRLAELGALIGQDTLIVVVGDHGENLGDHHLLGHNTSLADTLLRVPLVLAGPRELAGRGEVAAPVSTSLVAATLLAAAGLDHRGPTLLDAPPDGPALSWYESAYAEAAGARAVADAELTGDERARVLLTRRGWAAHRGPYKLVSHSDGSRSLFDIEADPGETRDLAAERSEVLARFEGISLPLEPVAGPQAAEPAVSGDELEEIEEHLRSLGYL